MTTDPFHQDNVKSFAAAWYQALDVHAPTDDLARLLVDEGLQMIFPEKTLIGMGDFQAWYAGGSYADGEKAPGVINIFFDEVHVVKSVDIERRGDELVVDVVVGWQASWFTPPAAKSTRTAMDATQRWTLRRCADGKNPFGLEITSYNAMAKPFVYAPGFATL
jgi:hypothetical protein